jgi:16S rRNA (guanine966-N2)-methyltransferase
MPQVRITGGEFGGRRLYVPKTGVRPTTGRVREAIFSMLGSIDGARVLDLFCGSGALGIEALSRGAAEAALVDSRPAAARRNVEELGLVERAEVVRSDAVRFLRRTKGRPFDLVLCDPPYKLADRLAADLVHLIPRALAAGGRVMFESSPRRPLDLELPLLAERSYGDTMIRIYGDVQGCSAGEAEEQPV